MSDTPPWVAKEKLEYECPSGDQWSSDASQATRALISIANSLAILADETDDITPITHAAFIIGDAMCQGHSPPDPEHPAFVAPGAKRGSS